MHPETVWIPELSTWGKAMSRISGLPVGFPQEMWPNCQLCGKPLAFIAQFEYGALHLDVKSADILPDSIVYIFMCRNFDSQHDCESHIGIPENSRGTHSVIVHVPEHTNECARPAELPHMERGLHINGFIRKIESCPKEIANALLFGTSNHDWPRGYTWELHQTSSRDVYNATKVGGVPSWIHEPFWGVTVAKWRYVMQLSDMHVLNDIRIWTTLESGRLFLLTNDDGAFELYYQGR
ncbi:MAG: hypothetical protein JXR76_30990 [Deltaproteobacteria bacterium]|nr:hypothetical protein [Deltaproteobacteria bacterium]